MKCIERKKRDEVCRFADSKRLLQNCHRPVWINCTCQHYIKEIEPEKKKNTHTQYKRKAKRNIQNETMPDSTYLISSGLSTIHQKSEYFCNKNKIKVGAIAVLICKTNYKLKAIWSMFGTNSFNPEFAKGSWRRIKILGIEHK